MRRELLVLVGPTASGKTALAEAMAAEAPCTLISADSQQVYNGLDIGTAKPSPAMRQHWKLIDQVPAGGSFSAGDFARLAASCCEEAWATGRLPVIAGGTGLYLKALLEGIADIPPIPSQVRRQLTEELGQIGLAPMLERLDRADPTLAAQIDRKNPRRVLRALEVYEATGQPLSVWQSQTTKASLVPERTRWVGLDPGTESLDARIEARVDACLADGWPQEVERLIQALGPESLRHCPAIGYAELALQIEGALTAVQARHEIVLRTKQYARRQRTWFKALPSIQWHANAGPGFAQALITG